MRQSYITNAPMYWYDASYDCSWLLEGVRWNSEIWGHLFGVVMARYDISKRDPIGVPVFLSLGRYDFVVPYTAWDGISKVLPNITVHLFDKSGHWAFVEEPDRFDTALREWVTRLGPGGK